MHNFFLCFLQFISKQWRWFYVSLHASPAGSLFFCPSINSFPSWQWGSCSVLTWFLWTLEELQTLTSNSSSSLTRRRNMTPRCTKRHWIRYSTRPLCSRYVLLKPFFQIFNLLTVDTSEICADVLLSVLNQECPVCWENIREMIWKGCVSSSPKLRHFSQEP